MPDAEESGHTQQEEFCTHWVVQAVDLQHHGLGPLVGGTQEELSLTAARGGCFGLFGLSVARVLQDLVDFRSQQFGLPWGCAPEGSKRDHY